MDLMRQFLLFLLTPPLLVAQLAPSATGVVNGASFVSSLSPGALASIFGSNLASGTAQAQSLPLPAGLLGSKVLIEDSSGKNSIAAPLYFVSPGQINFQIPFESAGPKISVTVSTPNGASNVVPVNLTPMAPAIFSKTADGAGAALAFDGNFQPLDKTPRPGSAFILYAAGLGATTPAATTGAGGSASPPLNQVAAPFDVYIGGSRASIAWAGLAPGFAGVYQLNIVPSAEAVGDVVIRCRDCSESNHVHMPPAPLRGGPNTANASGSVTILYPANQPKLTYSPGLVVAKVTARFDIKPGAGRFTLSVVTTVGSTSFDNMTITFDPAAGQYSAMIPAPAAASRQGDFSQTGVRALDFLTGMPLPGNIVPLSRIDPNLLIALRAVPLPNTPPTGLHSFYAKAGSIAPGSTFTMDDANNADLLTFASFGAVSPLDLPVTVTLSVDGQVLDIATSTFRSFL